MCFFLLYFLLGALGSSPLSFILPCLFHIRIRYQHVGKWTIGKDVLIIVFGAFCAVIGVIVTMKEMVTRL